MLRHVHSFSLVRNCRHGVARCLTLELTSREAVQEFAVSFATAKVGGSSAGAFAEYLSEQADLVADYYGSRELDGLAFTRVQGKAASYLGVEQGLTMEQFEDLHHGRWNGQQLSQMSYR